MFTTQKILWTLLCHGDLPSKAEMGLGKTEEGNTQTPAISLNISQLQHFNCLIWLVCYQVTWPRDLVTRTGLYPLRKSLEGHWYYQREQMLIEKRAIYVLHNHLLYRIMKSTQS